MAEEMQAPTRVAQLNHFQALVNEQTLRVQGSIDGKETEL